MRERLRELLNNSYSPYSNFKVAAILVTKEGLEFNGVNVENASYGATICAERSAFISAISNGCKKGDFNKLYIMTDTDKISTCCFMCRQVISELMDKNSEIICMSRNDEKVFKLTELCPYPFDEEDLK